MIRCARCGTSWLARHFDGDVYASAAAAAPLVSRQPLIIEGEVVRPPRRPAASGVRQAAGSFRATAPRPVQPPSPRFRGLAAGIGLALILAVTVPIAAAIPGIAGLFGASEGIVLSEVRSTSMTVGGDDAIVVEGTLVNGSRHAMPVPAVRVSLRGNGDSEAYSWLVEPSMLELAPGASVSFRSALANPVPGARRVAATLAPRDQRIGLR